MSYRYTLRTTDSEHERLYGRTESRESRPECHIDHESRPPPTECDICGVETNGSDVVINKIDYDMFDIVVGRKYFHEKCFNRKFIFRKEGKSHSISRCQICGNNTEYTRIKLRRRSGGNSLYFSIGYYHVKCFNKYWMPHYSKPKKVIKDVEKDSTMELLRAITEDESTISIHQEERAWLGNRITRTTTGTRWFETNSLPECPEEGFESDLQLIEDGDE